jgi:hypothetical protein
MNAHLTVTKPTLKNIINAFDVLAEGNTTVTEQIKHLVGQFNERVPNDLGIYETEHELTDDDVYDIAGWIHEDLRDQALNITELPAHLKNSIDPNGGFRYYAIGSNQSTAAYDVILIGINKVNESCYELKTFLHGSCLVNPIHNYLVKELGFNGPIR